MHRVQREHLRSYYPTFGKGLEVVEIINSHICGDDMRMILSNASNLRCFRYNHQPVYRDRGDDWSIGDFTAAIEETVFASLEELTLCVETMPHYPSPTVKRNAPSINSMKKFAKLRQLEIDVRLLLPSQTLAANELDIPRLISLLPVSIESLILLTDLEEYHVDGTEYLLEDFPHGTSTQLPNLRNITIKCSHNGSTYGGEYCVGRDSNDPRWQRIESLLKAFDGKLMEVDGDVEAEFMATWDDRFGW